MFQNRIMLILLFITLLSSLVIQQVMTMHVVLASPSSCQALPNDGRPQPQKGANADPDTWKVVPMRDDPSLFKVVDSAGINVADRFHSRTNAEQFVAHYVCVSSPPSPPPPATPGPIYCTDGSICVGTDGNDVIEGTPGRDVIEGFMGDDTINGNGGKDDIRSGYGDDTIHGNGGDDFIEAGAGNDEVYGEDGANTLRGNDGNDEIRGGDNRDIITGGAGRELIFGFGGDDLIIHGNPNLSGVSAAYRDGSLDVINCGDGNDRVTYNLRDNDFVADCETLNAGGAPPPPPPSPPRGNEDCDRPGMPGCP